METIHQEVKELLGESYNRALEAYQNSNAAKSESLHYGFGLPKAAYDFLETAKKVFSSSESSDQAKRELSQVIYGILILYQNQENVDENQARKIIETMDKVCENASFFASDDDSLTMQRVLKQLCTFFQSSIDSDTSTKP